MWNDDPRGVSSIGEQLKVQQKRQLEGLLEKYQDVFSNKPGRTNRMEHHIETQASRPVRLPPYRLPHAYRETVEKELKEMEECGIIEPSFSEWASPIFVIKKKDGTLRLCVDYHRLNSASEREAYPMTRIDDLIDRVGNPRFISTIDLTRGNWQMPVAPKDQHKTAFVTRFGLYQFKVLPFGLGGAPASFQRLMDRLINGYQDFAAAYLDDLVIFSSSWEDHLRHLTNVLKCLKEAGLTAKPSKCQFAMKQCVYLGHIVGNGIIQPESTKLKAVHKFPVPKTKKPSYVSQDITNVLLLISCYTFGRPD